ncbi:hypothetical protein AKJ61_01850 [candidate division MSBL1 archaeon SCGC-AAA259B11]|uniref:Uncharacterized protein n=1 Tax=candidate division MSBL1 archaeon SCGC-AAA259B11 TaxID=1698260 RepID=A0A133U6V1_9EURY|nr:hypothetical protein AKJ61_01850 [candidate division MSBL1 archaeon SCGC-AAA259B11]
MRADPAFFRRRPRRLMDKKSEVVLMTGTVFPDCPACEEGVLVPFSFSEDVFEKWKCNRCGFVLQKKE